jgi:hypothetical protein
MVLASVAVTAYRVIRVSAPGPAGKGILIGVYQVEGDVLFSTCFFRHRRRPVSSTQSRRATHAFRNLL